VQIALICISRIAAATPRDLCQLGGSGVAVRHTVD
jgi:hypothetical protein